MAAAFPEYLIAPGEIPLMAYPASFTKDGELVEYYRQVRGTARASRDADRKRQGWLTCVSTVDDAGAGGLLRRRAENLHFAYILPLDDILTKAKPPPVRPSVILETSPGNYQWHYFIDPFDVSGPKGQAYYDACLVSCADAGYSDPGMRSAGRVCKLPGAIHKTGFVTRVVEWAPERSWDLKSLMAEMGVRVRRTKPASAAHPGKYVRLQDVDDGVYRWLVENWVVRGHNDQWVHIDCPWREHHTDRAQGSSSTSYSPLDYGRAGRGFKCLHGHCQGRTLGDFLEFARSMGAKYIPGE